jgi:hypothetical protein
MRMVQNQDMDVPELDEKEASQVNIPARNGLFGGDFGLESSDSSNIDEPQPSPFERYMEKEKEKEKKHDQSNSGERKQIEQPVSELLEIDEDQQVDDVEPSVLEKKSIEVEVGIDNEDEDEDLFNGDGPDKQDIDEDALQNDDKIVYQQVDESKDHELSSSIINQSNTQNDMPMEPIPDSNELNTPIYQHSHNMVINDPEDNLELKILEDHSDPLFEDSNKESPGKSSNNESVVDLDKQDSPIDESQINDIGKPQ